MSNGPTFPSGNASDWHYDLALAALTGESYDIHGPATPSGGWLKFDDAPSAKDAAGYSVYGDYLFGATLNTDALQAWRTAVNTIDGAMADFEVGNRGALNVVTISELWSLVHDLVGWLERTATGFHHWATDLNSHDSGFKGKAAYVIQSRLQNYGDGLTDLQTQLTTKHGYAVADSLDALFQALLAFCLQMAAAWHQNSQRLANLPMERINLASSDIM